MARVTPTEMAEKWARRTSAATGDMAKGIDRVTVAPGQAAAAAQNAMLTNLTAAVTSGRWAKNTAAVSLADWKAAAKDKGVQRVAQGVTAAQPKMARVAATLLPAVDAAAAQARAIPKVTIEDSINRMATFARAMRAYKERG